MAGIKFKGFWVIKCYDRYGKLKWRTKQKNLVVDEGIQHILDVTFDSAAQNATWYTGLTSASPSPSASDSMSSHSGWVEFTDYSEATRPEYIDSRTENQVDNDGNEAEFNINSDGTIGGAFLTSNSTKGGSSGVLLCATSFNAGNRTLSSGDIVKVEYQFTGSSA